MKALHLTRAALTLAMIAGLLSGCTAEDDVASEATALWEQRMPGPEQGPPAARNPAGAVNVGRHPGPPPPANASDDPPSPVPAVSDAHIDEIIDAVSPASEGFLPPPR